MSRLELLTTALLTLVFYPTLGFIFFQRQPSVLGQGFGLMASTQALLWFSSLLLARGLTLLALHGKWPLRTLNGWLLLTAISYDFNVFGIPIDRTAAGWIRGPLLLVALWQIAPSCRRFLQRISAGMSPITLALPPWRRTLPAIGVSAVVYTLAFLALTYPHIHTFSSSLWADPGDGYQMYWNVWWFKKALTDGTNPWFTDYLHAPWGATLLGASFHPLKSLMALPLLNWLTLSEAYNALIIITFVLNGVGAFLLCLGLTQNSIASLLGGFLFAFSNNRFAHANGHLHTISSEWIPVFLLVFFLFLHRPSIRRGFLAALLLLINLLSDHYAFLYSALLALFFLSWHLLVTKNRGRWMKESVRGFTALAASSAVLCGPLIIPTLISTVTDHWTGAHSPVDNSMDLLGLFIPGAHWRFSHFTRAYWTQILANGHEASVHLGFGVVILLLTLWFSPPSREKARPWFCLFVTFWILSLGSYLNVWGRELPLGLPYNFLVRNVPGFALSGVPIRFVMIISLAAAVLAAQAFLLLRGTSPALLGALLLVALFEHIPSDLPASPLDVPSYVEKLKLAPEGAVVDLASKETEQLYYQTVHNHPMAFGYIARVPQRLVESGNGIRHLAEEKRFDTLCHDLHFRYLVDTSGSLIDLHTSPGCATQKISLRKN